MSAGSLPIASDKPMWRCVVRYTPIGGAGQGTRIYYQEAHTEQEARREACKRLRAEVRSFMPVITQVEVTRDADGG